MTRPHASVHLKNAHETRRMYNRIACCYAFPKIGKMPKMLMKREKCITRLHAFVHFENGQNAKNDLKPTNAKKCS